MLLFFSINLQGQQLSLFDYLSMAAENNLQLKSLFNQYLAKMEKLPQVKSLPDPRVMFNIFTSPVETRVGAQKFGLSINQVFPWFGQLKAQEEVTAFSAKAKYEGFKDEKNRLFFRIKSIYYNLYILERSITITNENFRLLNFFRELVNVRLEVGSGSAVDFLRVEMDIAEMENQLELLKDARQLLRVEFREMLNVDLDIPIYFPDSINVANIQFDKDVLKDSLVIQNPVLKKIDFEIHSFNSSVEVAKNMGKPSFILGFGYTNVSKRSGLDFVDNGKDILILPQIGIRIPLYRKKYAALIRENNYMKTASLQQKESHKNRLFTELEKGWIDFQNAKRNINLYQKLIRLSEQSLDILLSEYTSANIDFEPILDMNIKVLNYKLELEKARVSQIIAVAYLDYLKGSN